MSVRAIFGIWRAMIKTITKEINCRATSKEQHTKTPNFIVTLKCFNALDLIFCRAILQIRDCSISTTNNKKKAAWWRPLQQLIVKNWKCHQSVIFWYVTAWRNERSDGCWMENWRVWWFFSKCTLIVCVWHYVWKNWSALRRCEWETIFAECTLGSHW